jgi:hypothetical protein
MINASKARDISWEKIESSILEAAKQGKTHIKLDYCVSFQMKLFLKNKGYHVFDSIMSNYTRISW